MPPIYLFTRITTFEIGQICQLNIHNNHEKKKFKYLLVSLRARNTHPLETGHKRLPCQESVRQATDKIKLQNDVYMHVQDVVGFYLVPLIPIADSKVQ